MRLDAPYALFALLLVPLALAGYVALERRPAPYAIRFTNLEVLERCLPAGARWRAHLPAALCLVALTCSLVALARPQQQVAVARPQASIVLAVDDSGSMAAGDVQPTRKAAAREAIGRFLARLPTSYRVGLVVFSSSAYVAAPLTRDREMVMRALEYAAAPGTGTAIGDALARSAALLELGPPSASPAILLLSDGAQTRGRLTPLQGAARAMAYDIPIHTVALGTPWGTIGEGVISLKVPPDPLTLQHVSSITGGESSAAMDSRTLDALYDRLATRMGWERGWRELGPILLGLAAGLALAGLALSLVLHGRMP